jgi:hypothetical protein
MAIFHCKEGMRLKARGTSKKDNVFPLNVSCSCLMPLAFRAASNV